MPQTAEVTGTVHKCLVNVEKSLNLWEEDMNRKRVPIDGGSKLHQKALSLYEGFSKWSPEMSDLIHITY